MLIRKISVFLHATFHTQTVNETHIYQAVLSKFPTIILA